jgi:NAD(P)-dependent dehydrogenase (short-subunit alcohol dehydrogenase family)
VSLIEHKKTKDGFELNMGTNHLGHFYLTSLLWERIKKVEKPRIINVSSLAHKGRGRSQNVGLDFDDLNMEKVFIGREAYGRSKLANILFAKELQNRMDQSRI